MTITSVDDAGTDPIWGSDELDLDAYLRRIDYDGPRSATLDTLRAVHRGHLATIGFIADGIDRDQLPIDVKSVQDKLVHGAEGGSCYEHNLLFAAVLTRLGFTVTRHLARVRRGNTTDIRFRSHTALLVEAEGERYLADVGFGDEGPLEPIPYRHGATLEVGGWRWRLDDDGEEWVLRSMHADGWFDVYSFTTEAQYPIDFEVAAHFSMTSPRSVFIGHVVAMRVGPDERVVLRDRILETRRPDFDDERRLIAVDEIVPTLRDVLGLTIPDDQAAKITAHLHRDRSARQ
ncbi:arylamine N-acetyltransferase [Streptomyces sp. LHD-70]|uniref:arylamine N-acetyltransferase family protein n=1 Tax=Streptomyces sp. LHD-70 TaxID=3072140 RepID=UPI00280FEFEA|nr:arylamine N-acetyltransferase [Streptomyces sp. LHD-70]MDQ8707241.1 arylamine N-acetyltransferase [Streptomyces sp. LHD-70]